MNKRSQNNNGNVLTTDERAQAVREYLVYRHEPNGAGKEFVLRVQATGSDEACRMAADRVPLTAGQFLSARRAGRAVKSTSAR